MDNDVKTRLDFAKQDLSNLLQPAQILSFSAELEDNEYVLLQLDKNCQSAIQEGQTLVIRGANDDSIVLCSENKTYDMKEVVVSNTIVLFEDCISNKENLKPYTEEYLQQYPDSVPTNFCNGVAKKFSYFELKLTNPRLIKIKQLLKKCEFKGFDMDSKEVSLYVKQCTLTNFLDIIPASEREITGFLHAINACQLNGYWRLLDFNYCVECMGELLQLIESESWDYKEIPVEDAVTRINDSGELVPSVILRHLFKLYGSEFVKNDLSYCCLDTEKVCRFFAEMLLKDVGKFNFSEFMQVWKESVPSDMNPEESFLSGLAIINKLTSPSTITFFSSEDLPLETSARFNSLFQAKPKWTYDEIKPYIEPICFNGLPVSTLLTKFTRASTGSGTKLYSSRSLV